MLRSHQKRLPSDVSEKIWDTVLTAARASMRRNVGPSYTNVCTAGLYLTLITGEALGDKALRDYGHTRLRRFVDFTARNGGFEEYNSRT